MFVCIAVLSCATLAVAQGTPTEQERSLATSAIRECVGLSVLEPWRDRTMARLEEHLAMPGTVWSKSRGGKVAVRNTMLYAEFSLALGELVMLDFSPRDNHHTVPNDAQPITGTRAQEIASAVLDHQITGQWRWADPLLASVGEVGASYFYRLHWNELPYDMSRARITLDRYTGCVTFLSKSFTALPALAPGYDIGVSEETRVVLRAEALQAYARWRPLDEATLGHMEVAYHIPSFADLDNELTESHLQIVARKEMIPLFRVSLRGTRNGNPFLVNLYVDVLTRKTIAIKENDLRNLPTLGSPSMPAARSEIHELLFLSGDALQCEPSAEPGLSTDGSIVLCTRSDGVLLFNVDTSKKLLWYSTGLAPRSFRVSADGWRQIESQLGQRKKSFGKAPE